MLKPPVALIPGIAGGPTAKTRASGISANEALRLRMIPSEVSAGPLRSSQGIEATGSHVPHKGLVSVHATSMPDAVQAGCRLLLDLSRSNDSFRFRHHSYAFDTFPAVHSLRLPRPHLTRSRRAVSADAHHPRSLPEQLMAVLNPSPPPPSQGPTPHPPSPKRRSCCHLHLLPPPPLR